MIRKTASIALGLPLGASGGGDAESSLRTVILDFGGRLVDENGKVVVNSPETLAAMEYIASLYEEGANCPPDPTTWDDSANNSAWMAGTVGMVCNSGFHYFFYGAGESRPSGKHLDHPVPSSIC